MALKHVIVGGGTGFIGSQLIKSLNLEGVSCTCISRMPGPNRISWNDLERYGLPENTSAVVNIAGQNVLDPMQRWSPGFKQNVRNSRVKTTKALADAIKNTKATVFATISGVAYYKPNGTMYTEESKCEPYDFLSRLTHDWEEAAKLSKDCNIRQVTIRSGVVLGRNGGMIKQIYLPFFLGLGGPIGTGNQYMPWIHISDLVNMFIFALKNSKVHGILNGVAPQILFSEDRAKIMLEGQKVMPKRVTEIGFQYQYPNIENACKQLVE